MNRKWKKALNIALEPPAPVSKHEFLERFPQPVISGRTFVLSQIKYTSKYMWGISLTTFLLTILGSDFFEQDMIWTVSALIPFLALSFVAETSRSQTYGMQELEMTTRFSFRSLILARMGISGAFHLCLLIVLIAISALCQITSVFQTGLYLLVSYLSTAFFGLWIIRKFSSPETLYACTGIAAGISCLGIFTRTLFPFFYTLQYTSVWLIIGLTMCILVITELWKNMKQTEELPWNYS